MTGRGGFARAAAIGLAAALLTACLPDARPPSPTPSPSPSAARPRFELSTYQYGLQTKGKIRVAVRDASPPLSSRAASGRYEGLEPDIARAIAKAIWGAADDPETHIEWISVDASTRVSALTSAQADISLAALAATDDLRKTIDVTDTYLKTGQRLLVRRTNDQITDLASISTGEQTVCAIRGSSWAEELRRATSDRVKILELETLDFCVQALGTGAADAVTADEVVLLGIVQKDPAVRLVVKAFTDQRLVIGVKKDASGDRYGFVKFLNETLLKIVTDRTWAGLYETHIAPLTGEKKQIPTD